LRGERAKASTVVALDYLQRNCMSSAWRIKRTLMSRECDAGSDGPATITPTQISKRASAAAPLEGIEVRRSEIHGQGVFAIRAFRVGEEVGLYAGRRYGAQGGNATRHVNHACAPNVEAVERYAENDELELVVCAIRRIRAGEELSRLRARH
jgi:hypothetical protein